MSQSNLDLTEPNPAASLSVALERAVERAAPSVVRVASPRGHATSGTVWTDDGLILTTHRGTARAPKLSVYGQDERAREVELVGRDPGTDLALLRVDPDGLRAIERAPDLPRIGALSLALARPGWRIRASLRTVGLVGPSFRTHHGGRLDAWLETDRALPSGFSGGPLIDVDGRMLGLDTRALVRHADLAVPIATIERIAAELIDNGAVRRGWLGVSLVPIALPDHEPESAVLVAGLEPDAPAAAAGVLLGDILVAVDGAAIDGPSALREALRGRAGQPLTLELIRAGERSSLTATPTDQPS